MKGFVKRLVIFAPALFLWFAVVFGDKELQRIAIAVGVTEILFLKGMETKE